MDNEGGCDVKVTTNNNIVETSDRRFNDIDERIVHSGLFNDRMFFVGRIGRWQYFGNEDCIMPNWFVFYVLPLYTILRRSDVLLKKNILCDEEIFCLLITGQAGRQLASKWSLCTHPAVAFTCTEFVDQKCRLNGHSFLCVLMITGSTIFVTDDIEEVDESNELQEAMIDNVVVVPHRARSLFERTTRNIRVIEINRSWHDPRDLPPPVNASRIERAESPTKRSKVNVVTSPRRKIHVASIASGTSNSESSLTKRRAIVDGRRCRLAAPINVQTLPPTKKIPVASVTNDPRTSERASSPFRVVDDASSKSTYGIVTSGGSHNLQSQIRSRGVYDEEFDRFLQNAPPSFFTSDVPGASVDPTN